MRTTSMAKNNYPVAEEMSGCLDSIPSTAWSPEYCQCRPQLKVNKYIYVHIYAHKIKNKLKEGLFKVNLFIIQYYQDLL